MYYMYMGQMQIPVPPPELTTRIGSRNKTIELLDKGEVTVIRNPGLAEVSMRFLLPNSMYPFSQQVVRGVAATFLGDSDGSAPSMLTSLEEMKVTQEPFQFIVVRMKDNGSYINMMNLKVTLEDYAISEAAVEGYDMYANVKMKAWREYGAKKIKVTTDSEGNKVGTTETTRPTTGHDIPKVSFMSKPGETLAQAAKRALGSAASWEQLASINKIAIPAILTAGQVIRVKTPIESASEAVMY